MEATVHLKELDEARAHHVRSMVQHHTIERILNGSIKDRISKKELHKKLKTALKQEGIHGPFEYAVYNNKKKDYESGYISKGFDKKQKDQLYSKMLFPSDRRKKSEFELIVQCNDRGGYVWNGVQQMALLSALFTILILFSFGYSLYFIFKQKKISKIKNDFINNMTHELKTPLASISLASASINHPEVISKPEEIKKFTAIIESEKHRMNSHIERVLDIATLDKGDLKLDLNPTDLVSIIQSSIKNVSLSLSEIEAKQSFRAEMDSAPMNADEFHLINVLTNVLDNSIKYRRSNLEIDIELKTEGKHYLLVVKDNGIGMSSKEQGLAFDKFYRAETGNIHNSKGFGLGLSYVKSIIEQHQGEVSMKSQPNKGTTVTIKLPITNE